ncbi:MAG: preprotein translocase subunit YajC [Gaiellaceae bacterium]
MSPIGLVLIVIAFLFIYLALLRPQKRRQAEQAQMWQTLETGDEVVTAGGLYGEITGFRGDDVLVEIAPDLEVRIARRAIAAVVAGHESGEEPDEAREEPAGYPESGDE